MRMRWLGLNLRTLLLAFIMAIAVWVSSVTASDPDEVKPFPSPIPIEIVGQDPTLVITGNYPKQVTVTLRAPRSIWEQLVNQQNSIRAILDLSGRERGQHNIPLQIQIAIRPVRQISVNPSSLTINLEPLVTRSFPVELSVSGDPAIGYQAGSISVNPTEVVVSGPESIMSRATAVRVALNLDGERNVIDANLPLLVYDGNGLPVSGLTLSPQSVHINLPITQLGGYRDLAVKVVVVGQVANGYRLTNISVDPPVVTVFGGDPQIVSNLPGFVETAPLNLTGANADISTRLNLSLPEGVLVVGDQSVQVQVSIAAMEGSMTIVNKQVEIVGLAPRLSAMLSPDTVDIFLTGPIPILDTLKLDDIRVIVDLTGLAAGTHQVTPQVELLVERLAVESINPLTIEVVITSATPTPRP